MEVEEKPDVSYAQIGGLEEQIVEIKETVELPLKKPDLFTDIGIEPPRSSSLRTSWYR